MRFLHALLPPLLFLLTTPFVACSKQDTQYASGSDVAGLSASASAQNAALLLTASSSTPGYHPYFTQDMSNMAYVLKDPTGNWKFKTHITQEATAGQMASSIEQIAGTVSEDGTLLIFIAAHGAPNGMIAANGSEYANFGYENILAAIQKGRQGKPFRRLVLFVSSCYSGSWFHTLKSSNGLIKERLVITSVTADQLSYIGQATGHMASVFQRYAKSPGLTMRQFLNTLRTVEPSLQYLATVTSGTSDQLLDEPFVNGTKPTPATKPSRETTGTNDSAPESTTAADTATAPKVDFRALTKTVSGQTVLYIYSSLKAQLIEATDNKDWYPSTQSYEAQEGWPSIVSLSTDAAWVKADAIKVHARVNDIDYTLAVKIHHQ